MAYNRKDAFYTRAKAAGYRSRAAYKLAELAERYRLIMPGDHVVDLGAWPGGWLQVAAHRAGPRGIVVGVDLVAVDPIPGVSCIRGNALDEAVQGDIVARCGGRVDVVLCDMSPKLTGVRARDEAQAAALVIGALGVTRRILKAHGRMVVKVFMTSELDAVLAEIRRHFRSVKLTRPDATRKGSAELYAIALDFISERSSST